MAAKPPECDSTNQTSTHMTQDRSTEVESDGSNSTANEIHLRHREKAHTVSRFSQLLHRVAQSASYDPPIKKRDNHPAIPGDWQPLSTSYLILQDRPSNLPEKSAEEKKRHMQEYMRFQSLIRQKLSQEQKEHSSACEITRKREQRREELLRIWRMEIMPNWDALRSTRRLRRLVWAGIPSALRRDVWSRLAGNTLQIDRSLFDRCLELSRTRLALANNYRLRARHRNHTTGNTSGDGANTLQSNCSMCDLVLTNLNSTPLQHELSLGYVEPRETALEDDALSQPTVVDQRQSTLSDDSGTMERDVLHTVPLQSPLFYHSDRTVNLRAIKLDVSRTFPSLGLFQPGNQYHDPLHDLLAAYVTYRPEIGYVQGMSFLAAILLLVMHDTFDAFVLFANLLERPCHRAFYSLDENEFTVYFRAFDQTLADCMPLLHAHFQRVGLEPNMYLFDWLFTIFSRSLPLEANFRVWDVFFLDGELALFRAALGLLQLYEARLLQSNFDQLATFLTSSMPSDLSEDDLVDQMCTVGLRRKTLLRRIKQIRANLLQSPSDILQVTPQLVVKSSKPLNKTATRKRLTQTHDVNANENNATPITPKSDSGSGIHDPPTGSVGPVDHSVASLYSPTGSTRSVNLISSTVETMPNSIATSSGEEALLETGETNPPSIDLTTCQLSVPDSELVAQLMSPCLPIQLRSKFNRSKSDQNAETLPYTTLVHNSHHNHQSGDGFQGPLEDRRLRACMHRMAERVP